MEVALLVVGILMVIEGIAVMLAICVCGWMLYRLRDLRSDLVAIREGAGALTAFAGSLKELSDFMKMQIDKTTEVMGGISSGVSRLDATMNKFQSFVFAGSSGSLEQPDDAALSREERIQDLMAKGNMERSEAEDRARDEEVWRNLATAAFPAE